LLLGKRRVGQTSHINHYGSPPNRFVAATKQLPIHTVQWRMTNPIARVINLLLPATVLWSQVSDPAFEVASIKTVAPSDRGLPGQMIRDPGRVSYRNVSLQNLLAQAYRIKNLQISGPDWLDSDRFDIVAKLPKDANENQLPAMLQGLLKERFKLAFHREPRMLTAYVLTTAKGGPKLHPADAEGGVRTTAGATRRGLSGKMGMTYLAGLLSNMLDRPVVNMTDIKGIFDIDLEWSVNDTPETMVQPDDPPSLFTVLQEKLGLRLESRKAPVDVYVIDHVERVPTEN
jgi:uncharacterized protein (TIGR03435 family)